MVDLDHTPKLGFGLMGLSERACPQHWSITDYLKQSAALLEQKTS